MGNQSDGHNFSFTTEIHTDFTYEAGQTFSFTGDDDMFVYINKTLAIDLGGVHSAETAAVDLDNLSLTAGDTYQLDIFNAERHPTGSDFGFTTNIVLNSKAVPEPTNIALLTAAMLPVGLIGGGRRSRTRDC